MYSLYATHHRYISNCGIFWSEWVNLNNERLHTIINSTFISKSIILLYSTICPTHRETMSSITNVMRLLNNVITGEYPEYLPRSSSEVITLLGGLKSREEVYLSHYRRMKGVTNHELKTIYDFVAASIVMVTDITKELMELASGDSRVKSFHVYEALRILYLAFGAFKRLAGKVKTLPQPEKDRCFGYVGGCYNYSILFQKLLYPEDECDHLEIYAQALGHDFQFCFKIDTDQDYSSPGSSLRNGFEKTLSACIPPANQIPVYCHLTAQPDKPVCPQFYRNPYFYGPRTLRNQNHESNREYFRMKEDREKGIYRTKAATINDTSYNHGGKVVKELKAQVMRRRKRQARDLEAQSGYTHTAS